MKQVVEGYGKTVEAAIADGAAKLGVDRELVTYEILEMPKKGFLGFGEIPAKVSVAYDGESEDTALSFVKTLIADMGIDATAEMSDIPNGKLINISGEGSGILIGHHGATLDALQYLVNLAANKKADHTDEGDAPAEVEETEAEEPVDDGETGLRSQMTERARRVARGYMRITVDVENYRAKREETLRVLARRMASRVQKYKRSITLEPMNPYERRIIHSEIQGIAGVTTTSVGTDNDRKIVIYLENGEGPFHQNQRKPGGRYNGNRRAPAHEETASEADTSVQADPAEQSADEAE